MIAALGLAAAVLGLVRGAERRVRRLLNQTQFERLYVDEHGVQADVKTPVAHEFTEAVTLFQEAFETTNRPSKNAGPVRGTLTGSLRDLLGSRVRVSRSWWRCRESNPGPYRSLAFFYVRSRAIAARPPRFVRHCAVTAQSLFAFPPAPVTGAIGESPGDARPRFGDASGWRLISA